MRAIAAGVAGLLLLPLFLVAAVTAALTGAGAQTTIASTEAATTAIAYARSQLGVPYLWGGESPETGFDCSGLVQTAYSTAGVRLPRTAQTQYDAGPLLPPGEPPQPGDLVFYGTPDRVYHVGLVISATHMIEAPYTGEVVRERPFARPDLLAFSRPAALAPRPPAPSSPAPPASAPPLRPPAAQVVAERTPSTADEAGPESCDDGHCWT